MTESGLLGLLCCPQTRQPLAPAPANLLNVINQRIAAGQLRNATGSLISEPFLAGWLREDRQVLYPVRNGLAMLLPEEGIALEL